MKNHIKNYVARYFSECHVHLISFFVPEMKSKWIKIYNDYGTYFFYSVAKRGTQRLIDFYGKQEFYFPVSENYHYPSYKYLRCDSNIVYSYSRFRKNKRILFYLQRDFLVVNIITWAFLNTHNDIRRYLLKNFPYARNFSYEAKNLDDIIFCRNNSYRYQISWTGKTTKEEIINLKQIQKYCKKHKLIFEFNYHNFEQYCFLHNNNFLNDSQLLAKINKVNSWSDLTGLIPYEKLKLVYKKFELSFGQIMQLLSNHDNLKYWAEIN